MARWQYCMLSNPAAGTDSVRFTHSQDDDIVQRFSKALGKGLKAENSKSWFLHLNMGHTTSIAVSGLLGNEGWELVSHAVLTGGHEYWTFKREAVSA